MQNYQDTSGDALDRPIATAEELIALFKKTEIRFALLSLKEFLKLFQFFYPGKITQRTLQLYISPKYQLMPPPVHKGGHISYYLYPEHSDRLRIIMELQSKYFMPLNVIAKVVQNFPRKFYYLIQCGALGPDDIEEFGQKYRGGSSVKDIMFSKISELLMDMYFCLEGSGLIKFEKENPAEARKFIQNMMLEYIQELGQWMKAGPQIKFKSSDEQEMARGFIETRIYPDKRKVTQKYPMQPEERSVLQKAIDILKTIRGDTTGKD
ncbi:MAG: hypothetical protein HY401_01580 [Elusimicrobia bacterium]|nr:hypothetical protein [Elusimicrobiota bacterium]